MVFRDTKFHAKIIKLMFLIFHWGHDVSVSLLGYVKVLTKMTKFTNYLSSDTYTQISKKQSVVVTFLKAKIRVPVFNISLF